MAFAGEINYRKRGLSIGLALVLVIFVMATLGAPAPASAATINCGQCHGTIFNNASTGSSGSVSYDARATGAAPGYENKLLPQNDNERGLHGIHRTTLRPATPRVRANPGQSAEIHGAERQLSMASRITTAVSARSATPQIIRTT